LNTGNLESFDDLRLVLDSIEVSALNSKSATDSFFQDAHFMIEICTNLQSESIEVVEQGLLYLKAFLSRSSSGNAVEYEEIRCEVTLRLKLVSTYKKLNDGRDKMNQSFVEWSRVSILALMKESLQSGKFSDFALMWRRHWRGMLFSLTDLDADAFRSA
jgi:hypothetical protein